jgi:hypothetical protein
MRYILEELCHGCRRERYWCIEDPASITLHYYPHSVTMEHCHDLSHLTIEGSDDHHCRGEYSNCKKAKETYLVTFAPCCQHMETDLWVRVPP